MVVSSAEGGANPDMNLNLAQIVEQCRNNNLPKATIEAAIKNAVGYLCCCCCLYYLLLCTCFFSSVFCFLIYSLYIAQLMHVCVCVFVCVSHTYTHAYIHTHIYTYTYPKQTKQKTTKRQEALFLMSFFCC